jgi:hypothetical protein
MDHNEDMSVPETEPDPKITSFMSSQLAYDYNTNSDGDDDTHPTICANVIPETIMVSTYIPPPIVTTSAPDYSLRQITSTSKLLHSAQDRTPC